MVATGICLPSRILTNMGLVIPLLTDCSSERELAYAMSIRDRAEDDINRSDQLHRFTTEQGRLIDPSAHSVLRRPP